MNMPSAIRRQAAIPALVNGDHLTADEFMRRYEAMPEVKKAELIEGVVYMPSPVNLLKHGQPHLFLGGCFAIYIFGTPGVGGGDNSTVRLDDDNEPQPDLTLFIQPEFGGKT